VDRQRPVGVRGAPHQALHDAGGTLTYSFVESVKSTYPFYAIRLVGGTMFLAGMLVMAYNVARTIAAGRAVEAPIPALAPSAAHA